MSGRYEFASPCCKADIRFRLLVAATLLLFNSSFLIDEATAQVPNDDIEHRTVLQLNQSIHSSTTDCTVQWAAVDEKLTGKCIEYHNDQWFEFTPKTAGRYYVNIGGQQCRDTRGVQLVVLTGTPGQPATYQILSCTSLGSQDDVFVTLENLEAGQRYLLDVDGYLKDFCGFNLAVSAVPQGIPVLDLPPLATVVPSNEKLFTLRWQLTDSVGAVTQFRVLRREAGEFRAVAKASVPVSRTTYGGGNTEYAWTDTLRTPGRYLYQVVADNADGQAPALVQQQWYAYSQVMPKLSLVDGAVVLAAKQAAKAQQKWERRGHRARMKRLASLRKHSFLN